MRNAGSGIVAALLGAGAPLTVGTGVAAAAGLVTVADGNARRRALGNLIRGGAPQRHDPVDP